MLFPNLSTNVSKVFRNVAYAAFPVLAAAVMTAPDSAENFQRPVQVADKAQRAAIDLLADGAVRGATTGWDRHKQSIAGLGRDGQALLDYMGSALENAEVAMMATRNPASIFNKNSTARTVTVPNDNQQRGAPSLTLNL